MPFYKFKNKETQEVVEKFLKISEKESFLKDNPELESILEAPMLCDPVRVGARKMDTGFKEVLQKIHEKTPGSELNTISSQI